MIKDEVHCYPKEIKVLLEVHYWFFERYGSNNLLTTMLLSLGDFRRSWLGTLWQNFLTFDMYLTTCEVLCHNASEKMISWAPYYFWGDLGLITWRFTASVNERKHQIKIFHMPLFCYLVGLHDSGNTYRLYSLRLRLVKSENSRQKP